MKKIYLVFLLLILIGLVVGLWYVQTTRISVSVQSTDTVADFKDATYTINGEPITLTQGYAVKHVAPDSASQIVTQYFGNDVNVDVNNDGRNDVVFLLTQETGGSGTFYYVTVALAVDGGYVGTPAVFLGDRITPQTINSIDTNTIIVNYTDRALDEPYTTKPSVGISAYLQFDSAANQLVIIGNDSSAGSHPEDIMGIWTSTSDPLNLMIVEKDGSVKEVYNGQDVNVGTWVVRSKNTAVEPGDVFESVYGGETFQYTILEIEPTSLRLSYGARGTVLEYTKDVQVVGTVSPDAEETYINTDHSFSLTHPSLWEVTEAVKPREERALHEVVISEKMYAMWRASFSVFIFENKEQYSVQDWWAQWLADEDAKERECIETYGEGNAPCLYLRGLVQGEKTSTLAGSKAIEVTLFRFDHSEICTYTTHGTYVYGVCKEGDNPNDPESELHIEQTHRMQDSFTFL